MKRNLVKWFFFNLYLKHGKNISITIENEEIHLKYNFLFTGLHICRVGGGYREPLISFSLEVAWRCCSADILRKIVPKRSSAITETTLQVVSSRFRQVQFLTCVTKIKGQSSRSEHVTKIIWGRSLLTHFFIKFALCFVLLTDKLSQVRELRRQLECVL